MVDKIEGDSIRNSKYVYKLIHDLRKFKKFDLLCLSQVNNICEF